MVICRSCNFGGFIQLFYSCSVPMLLSRLEPDDVARPDLPGVAAPIHSEEARLRTEERYA